MPTGDLMMDVMNGFPFAVFYAAFTVMCVGFMIFACVGSIKHAGT